jgi:MMPL family
VRNCRGLAATARVISAAAAIMVVVFLSFDLTPDVSVKQIGLGLGAAVLVDATVVRLVLVPAVMELLGKANWWLPGWAGPAAAGQAGRGSQRGRARGCDSSRGALRGREPAAVPHLYRAGQRLVTREERHGGRAGRF